MLQSQPTRAAWIEIYIQNRRAQNAEQSQPTRAAWIEIYFDTPQQQQPLVAAHSGCVD